MSRDVRVKEQLKMGLRSLLRRRDLDLVRHPFMNRLADTLRWLGVDTVLDVGANIGQYGSALRSVGYRGAIHSFEPLSDAYAHLERRAADDGLWRAHRVAVGAQARTIDINVSANSYSSSVRTMTQAHLRAAPDSRVVRTETVPMTTVEQLTSEIGVAAASTLLKVDTQGFESDVLDGAGDLLDAFAAVQLELSMVPLYEAQDLYPHLVERMIARGFTLFGLEPGIADPVSGRLLQCDGVFVNGTHIAARAGRG